MPELSLMHIVMAATIRLIALRPYLNRFVVWNKIFARNHINMSLIIKRKLSNVETMIKPEFEPEDTLYDVVRRVSEEVNKNVADDAVNSSDETCNALLKLPAFVMRFVVKLLYGLDNIGLLPKKLFNVSPWHCSAFITNVGSLGIGPIYHHLYEFGTCSLFIAMGNKQRTTTVNAEGKPVTRRSIGLKFVTDERICDGQYYAAAMKMMRKLLEKPELLLEPPRKSLWTTALQISVLFRLARRYAAFRVSPYSINAAKLEKCPLNYACAYIYNSIWRCIASAFAICGKHN